MANDKKHFIRLPLVIRSLIIILFLALWEGAAKYKIYDSFFTSYPTEILNDLLLFISSGDLVYHAAITLSEAGLGLIIGTTLGMLLGILFADFKNLAEIINPIFSAINSIPQLALAPVYVLWFGLGLTSKVFLAGLMVFFNVFFPTYNAIRNTNQRLIESSQIVGANQAETMFYVIIPYCMPWIFSGIRAGIGSALVGSIIGEYMGAAGGFGWMISYATSYFMIERVMSCILILMIVGMSLNYLLDYIEIKVLHWREEVHFSNK